MYSCLLIRQYFPFSSIQNISRLTISKNTDNCIIHYKHQPNVVVPVKGRMIAGHKKKSSEQKIARSMCMHLQGPQFKTPTTHRDIELAHAYQPLNPPAPALLKKQNKTKKHVTRSNKHFVKVTFITPPISYVATAL